jgi:predicted HicB family RNase H-like nuclease
MNNKLIEYKGYLADLVIDIEDNIIVGRVINTTEIISFHGATIHEAKQSFCDVLNTYLKECEQKGIQPTRPYSGRFNLRINPELHKEISDCAAKDGKSLNDKIIEVLTNYLSNQKKSLYDFFQNSPLRGEDFNIKRGKNKHE